MLCHLTTLSLYHFTTLPPYHLYSYFYQRIFNHKSLDQVTKKLNRLFRQWSGGEASLITPLPRSGSERLYWRLSHGNYSAIGAWNPNIEENDAFFSFTLHFHKKGLKVPALYGIDKDRQAYLLEDLGDTSLFSLMDKRQAGELVSGEIIRLYRKSLSELVRFQVVAGKSIDYTRCYPYASFDKRALMWDLNYFKYYFLKLHLPFHERRLEDDFNTPKAITVFKDLSRTANRYLESGKNLQVLEKLHSLYRQFSDVLGIFAESGRKKIPREVLRLVEEREAARNKKDWAISDAIREKIKSMGYIVQDTTEGPNVKEAEES